MKPRLSSVLLWLVNDEAVGDLLDEFREERLPNLGRIRAELWYAREIGSIVQALLALVAIPARKAKGLRGVTWTNRNCFAVCGDRYCQEPLERPFRGLRDHRR